MPCGPKTREIAYQTIERPGGYVSNLTAPINSFFRISGMIVHATPFFSYCGILIVMVEVAKNNFEMLRSSKTASSRVFYVTAIIFTRDNGFMHHLK
jgi:hypothetical protein